MFLRLITFNKKKNILYPRIFLQIAIIVTTTILAVSILQYINSGKNTVQQISQFNIDSLEQVSFSAKLMADSAHNLISQLFLDQSIVSLRNFSNPDELQKAEALGRLNQFATCFNFIQSIYIYNGTNKTFYTTIASESVSSEDSFFDTGLISIFKTPDKIPASTPIARKYLLPFVPKDNKNATRVFSFIYCDTNTRGEIDSAIVVNVSEQWFHDVIKNINTVKEGDIIVTDTQGNILSSYLNRYQDGIPSQSQYIRKVLQSASNSGYMSVDIDGVYSLVTYVSLDKLQWTFIRTTPFSEIMKQTNKLMIETLAFSLLILLFGSIISVFLANMVYRPVDSVMSKLEKQLAQNKEDRNEFKNTFLRKLLLNEVTISESSWKQQQHKYNICFTSDDKVLLLLLKIDRFSEFCSEYNAGDRSLMKFALLNISAELVSPLFRNETVDMAQDHVILILEAGDGWDGKLIEKLKEIISNIQDVVLKYLQISICAVASNTGSFGEELQTLYQQTLDMSNYRFQSGHKSSILYSEFYLKEAGSYIFPQEKCEIILDSLKLKNFKKSEELFEEILQSTTGYSFSTIQSVLSKMLVQISSTLETAEKAWDIAISNDLNNFIRQVNAAETIGEVCHHYKEMLEGIDVKLSEKKASKRDDLIDDVMKIIQQDYANSNLCLEGIAEILGMSSAYLGRVFKKHTSRSVSDFIHEFRIQKAMELLCHTRKSIGEIVTSTGFSNTKYFFTLFKKFNGITPNEYRLNYAKKVNGLNALDQVELEV